MIRLSVRDADFEPRFVALLSQARETTETVDRVVAAILADVQSDQGASHAERSGANSHPSGECPADGVHYQRAL